MATRREVARIAVALVLGAAFVAVPGTVALADEGEATVTIVALRFTPDVLEISTGTVVQWENKEPVDYPMVRGAHRIVVDDGSFSSAEIAPGTRFSHRFLSPGTFAYHCGLNHPAMTGTLVVTGEPIREPQSHEVAIREGSADDPDTWGFSPKDISIDEGDTVTWRNDGSKAHTVTSDDDAFDSGEVAAGKTWQRRFGTAGVYRYHCTPHPWMTGVVRVAKPGGKPPEEPRKRPGRTSTGQSRDDVPRVVVRDAASGPARVTMRIIEPDPSSPNSWGFAPRTVRIRTGDTVVWSNEGNMLHTVTADDGSFDREMQPNATWERRFDAPGTFAFHCSPHPWMKGAVVVFRQGARDGGSTAAPSDMLAAPHAGAGGQPGLIGPPPPSTPSRDRSIDGQAAVAVVVRVAAWIWSLALATWLVRLAITRRRTRPRGPADPSKPAKPPSASKTNSAEAPLDKIEEGVVNG